jgi:DNA-binding response OmpR family regulator
MIRVLLIEDDTTSRLQLEAALRRGDFEPVPVGDAEAAYAALEGADAPRIDIMGWEMPGADGLDVLRWLRSDPSRAATWVMLLSGRPAREDEIAALDAGADDYVVKPVDAALLRAHVRAGARRVEAHGGGTQARAAA